MLSLSETEDLIKAFCEENPDVEDPQEFLSIVKKIADYVVKDDVDLIYNNMVATGQLKGKTKGIWVPDVETAKKEASGFSQVKRFGNLLVVDRANKMAWPEGLKTKTGYLRARGYDVEGESARLGTYYKVNGKVRAESPDGKIWCLLFEKKRGSSATEAYAVIKTKAPYGADSYKLVNDQYTAKKVAALKNSTLGKDNNDITYIYRKVNEDNAEKYNLPVGAATEGELMERYSVRKYGSWLFAIYDSETQLYVRKPGKENDKFAYDEKGKSNILTFTNRSQAQDYIDKNLNKVAIEATKENKMEVNKTATENEEELYGLEALEKTNLGALQSILAQQLQKLGSIQVLEKIIDKAELGPDFLDQVTFIKNTTDLSNTNEVLNGILDAAETLLDDVQVANLMESMEIPEYEEEEQPEEDLGEYEEPEDWGQVDTETEEEGSGEEQPEESEEQPEETEESGEQEVHESLEATGSLVERLKALGSATEEVGSKSLDEEEAYYWFDKAFDKWMNRVSSNNEDGEFDPTPEDWKEFEAELNNSPYDRSLLGWIWYQTGECLDDTGYSYDEFVSLCGHYDNTKDFSNYPEQEAPATECTATEVPATESPKGTSIVDKLKALTATEEIEEEDTGYDRIVDPSFIEGSED